MIQYEICLKGYMISVCLKSYKETRIKLDVCVKLARKIILINLLEINN